MAGKMKMFSIADETTFNSSRKRIVFGKDEGKETTISVGSFNYWYTSNLGRIRTSWKANEDESRH